MKLGRKRLQRGMIFILGVFSLVGSLAGSSQARVLESTNGPRITVGPAGHAYTKEELAKKNSGKPAVKKQKKTTASEKSQKEAAGKE
ncbi:hypothetical protein [Methylacidimicrobium tartarophylax]|uniref:Uncharacterized protein n=1 Tax=Methylacidimicrobium tartarophylax TaxID=1041768 RepID=A0A5E6MAQ1_9BACT|nr:hypothetical protein [Methylacidimicrobium tartarophylax]VVM06049.1 hypothetical protein MAMT_00933 [Methylacidimicrobium tartarophylax]